MLGAGASDSGARRTPCQTEHQLCRATLQTLPFAAARNLEVRYLGSSETPETAEPPWWDAATLNWKYNLPRPRHPGNGHR